MPRNTLPLDAFDLRVLQERGISLETALRNRLRTEGGALVIPYADLRTGAFNCYAVRRPHKPPVRDGKPLKYLAPAGQPSQPYFPAESRAALLDAAEALFITEGPLKALALAEHGFATVAPLGIWNWKQKGTDALLPDLAAIPLTGRAVNIVFDYDPKPSTRAKVAEARRRLARALLKAGARQVRNVVLPPGPGGAKQGVDDFLVGSGAEAFHELVAEAEPVSPVAPLWHPEGRTDAANALQLVAKHASDVRWVGPWDKFIIWTGQRWQHDDRLAIDLHAKGVAAEMFAEIATLLKLQERPDEKTLGAMLSHAKYSNSKDGIRNMITLAKSELAIGPGQLDHDPWVLNVENGTLDLRIGELRPHRREDFITKLAPVAFDPGAACPRWKAFLDTIFDGNAELGTYLQRLVGYCLTGDASEHILPFLFGTGANGKSTFVEVVLKLLGSDYSMKAPPDLLMAKRGESHPTDRADLFGKRFVACVETEEGRKLAEALTKELTGGDRVRARRMREDFWEFAPTHKVWLAGNHKPQIVGTDHGIWRRIKLIPFEVVISDKQQDKQLGKKLAAELPGVLNWALAGCLDWQRHGLQEPAIVQTATNDYAGEEDEVGQFLDECCARGTHFVAAGGELFAAFQRFVPNTGLTPHAFGARLRQHGFKNRHPRTGKEVRTNKGKKGWLGLRLIRRI